FSYHEKTQRVIMKVQDPETNETIREIPSRDMIKLLEHIHDFIGTFVDELR
ncbi:MAG TPA: flagellar protein FlaG, partial [Spirochaetes bacterium]|nr:flagellar protein FlaG [Spirochaetota bacterium]